MIKRIFTFFLMISFFISTTSANLNLPYTNNNEFRFSEIIGKEITSSIHQYNYNNGFDFCIDGDFVYHDGDGNSGGKKWKTNIYTKATEENYNFPCTPILGYNYDGRLGNKIYNGDTYFTDTSLTGLYKNSITPENLIVKDVFAFDISNNGILIYHKRSDNLRLYMLDLNNPQGYDLSKNKYTSDEILNTNEKVYIRTDTTLPSGTDYEFWLANESTEEVLITEGNNDIYYMGMGMNEFNDWSGMNDLSTIGVNVGDSVTLFKGTDSCDMVASDIEPWRIRLTGTCGFNGAGYGLKKGSANFQKLNNSVLDGNTEINTQTIFGIVTDKLFYKIILTSNDAIQTPVINSVNITITPQSSGGIDNNNGNTANGGVNIGLGDGTSINIPAEKQTTDFIKSLAKQSSINPASLNTIKNVETFLKDNNYDYKNQILIGSGVTPSQTMYNVINLGLNDNSLSNTLSDAINSTNYSKLVLTPETYLAGKRIINYLKMDKTDDNGNLIISIYNSDTKEYIFLRKKD